MKRYITQNAERHRSLLSEYCERMGDLVHRHRAAVALDAAKVDAELASKAKTEFIAKMSHELRTPLNAIIGFSEVLNASEPADEPESKVGEYSRYIEDSARHLLSIVNNILELSKIQSGRSTLNIELVDLEEVLSSCLPLFQETANADNIELRREVWSQIPLIEADLVKVRQIIINLLSNAVKFTPKGGRVTITMSPQDEDCVRLTIRDTGIGMSQEDLRVALEPFGQAEGGTERRFEGSGLGLPIVHALVAMHRGVVHVHSEHNKGTTITVVLPKDAESRSRMKVSPVVELFSIANSAALELPQGA